MCRWVVGDLLVSLCLLVCSVLCNYPVFDVNTQMRLLLLPSDARIGSVIYRLRATDADKDYPLTFDATDYGSYVIRIDNLPCTKVSPFCEANVFLERSLVPDQVFKFRMTVRDTKGDTTTVPATIQVTDGVTEFNQVFPHIPGVVMIPESTEVGTELEYVIVRRNPRAPIEATLELWGSPNFQFQQSSQKDTTTGVITLAAPLDYETKTMYKLSIFSVGQYVNIASDSRNIAGFQVVVVVTDVQDTPPIWDHIEPVTKLRSNLTQGDFILKVTARDGDKGSPRSVKYGLISEDNPFTVFFSIDQNTGEIRLDRPLKELASISRSHQPILLTVLAEEVVAAKGEPPAQSSTTTVAFLLGELGNTAPYFESHSYVARIDENSLQGTPLVFGDPYLAEVRDDNMGKQGIFSLALENNNGTFEISPSVAERQAQFIIRVRDNSLLDYESHKELKFKIVARELNPGHKQLSTAVEVTVYINDVNDNPPKFTSESYTARLPENSTAGISIIAVRATDVDAGDAGIVKYTSILGYKNTSLNLNPKTGLITVANGNHRLDREETSAYQFYIEARDMNGLGNVATVPFTLNVLDVNDNAPIFEKDPIEFILGPEGTNFSQKAIIKASDADAEPPNNVVYYEIVSGNYGTKFALNSETGELTVNQRPNRISRQTDLHTVTNLIVRAYDLGVPTKWSSVQVKIFPAESGARLMRFIVPGLNPDRYSTEQMLAEVTGGRVVIHSITPYRNSGMPVYQARTTDLTYGNANTDKSIVTATILYSNNAVVDLENLQKRLVANRTSVVKSEPVTVYKSESTALFWILILLLLLLFLTILTLLLCCLCAACPLYGMYNRKRSIVQSTDHINYMIHGKENKEVQAEWVNSAGRKEAWSGGGDVRRWSYGGGAGRRTNLFAQANSTPPPPSPQSYRHHGLLNHRPSVIFTRQLETVERHPQDELIIEDIDGTEYRLLDPSRLSLRTQRAEPNPDSFRRQDFERRSERAGGTNVMFQSREEIIGVKVMDDQDDENEEEDRPPSRDQMFIRDGNAEILRLVTRGKLADDEDPKLNQPQRPPTEQELKEEDVGKQVIMTRFIEDQRNSAKSRENKNTGSKETSDDLSDRQLNSGENRTEFLRKLLEPEHNISTADVNKLTTIQRDLLLTRFLVEEQRRSINRASIVEDTQSLPGTMSMATQTDVDTGTQTDKVYFAKRISKSDNDDSMSDSDGENDRRRFKRNRRFRRIAEDKLAEIALSRVLSRYEINTPILEESEVPTAEQSNNATPLVEEAEHKIGFSPTKTSVLREAASRSRLETDTHHHEVSRQHLFRMKSMSEQDIHSAHRNRQEVLMSLQVTPIKQINIPKGPNILIENVQYGDEARTKSGMSVTDVSSLSFDPSQRMSRLDVSSAEKERPRRASTSEPPRRNHQTRDPVKRSLSRDNLKKTSPEQRQRGDGPRYMEWYKKKREEREMKKRQEEEEEKKKKTKKWDKPKRTPNVRKKQEPAGKPPKGKSPTKDIVEKTNKASEVKNMRGIEEKTSKIVEDTNIVQTTTVLESNNSKTYPPPLEIDSEHVFPSLPGSHKLTRKNQDLLEKKSIFTIAYDDMQTKLVRIDTNSPPYNA